MDIKNNSDISELPDNPITAGVIAELGGNAPHNSLRFFYQPDDALVEDQGEKVLSSCTTLDNKVIFTTYTPKPNNNLCSAAIGQGSVCVVDVFTLEDTRKRSFWQEHVDENS